MLNLQIKTTQPTIDRFTELLEKSNCATRAEFMKKLLDVYQQPPIIESNEKDVQQIEDLKTLISEKDELMDRLQSALKEANEKIIFITERLENSGLPTGAIVLNFTKEFRHYFWGVNEICKKMGYSNSYEELVEKICGICYKRNELVLDKADCDYLESIPYDIVEEKEKEPENGNE